MKFKKDLYKLDSDNNFYKASEIVNEYKKANPNSNVISLGIGDVYFPISKYVAKEMNAAIKKQTTPDFIGYGNYFGIQELRKAIRDNEYKDFDIEEIYVSDGTKSDCGNILELLENDALIGIPSITYPIYKNTCFSLGRKFEIIKSDDNFIPLIPKKHFDCIILCSPNNPTGINYSKEVLKKWIDYAKKEDCLIIYDNVYFSFINDGVKSIYEIDGAKEVAIELRSFSKHVSFTGIRCSYFVIPNQLHKDINIYWRLRTVNRFNGASYIAQVGALASFNDKVKKEIDKNIKYYKDNASILKTSFIDLGYEVFGGNDAPYLWVKCKDGYNSFDMAMYFLNTYEIVIVPGSIFGKDGDNYFRISALGRREDILKAIERIRKHESKAN